MVMCAGGMRFTGRVEILRRAMACCTAFKCCVLWWVWGICCVAWAFWDDGGDASWLDGWSYWGLGGFVRGRDQVRI
jgi:hypothetical protein